LQVRALFFCHWWKDLDDVLEAEIQYMLRNSRKIMKRTQQWFPTWGVSPQGDNLIFKEDIETDLQGLDPKFRI